MIAISLPRLHPQRSSQRTLRRQAASYVLSLTPNAPTIVPQLAACRKRGHTTSVFFLRSLVRTLARAPIGRHRRSSKSFSPLRAILSYLLHLVQVPFGLFHYQLLPFIASLKVDGNSINRDPYSRCLCSSLLRPRIPYTLHQSSLPRCTNATTASARPLMAVGVMPRSSERTRFALK